MNILDSIDKYIKERWQDIIDLIEINNDFEIKLKCPTDDVRFSGNYIKESVKDDNAEKSFNFTEKNEMFEKLEFLSLLPETNPNMVLIVECDGNIIYSNNSTEKWLKENGFEKE